MLESSYRIALRLNPASTRSKLHVFGRRKHKARPFKVDLGHTGVSEHVRSGSMSKYAVLASLIAAAQTAIFVACQVALINSDQLRHLFSSQLRIPGVAAHQVILILQKPSRIRHQPCGRRRVDAKNGSPACDNGLRSSKMYRKLLTYRCRAYFPLSRGGVKVISSPESWS